MKILYDHQIFSSFEYSGISRYFCELIRELSRLDVDWEVACHRSNNRFLQELRPIRGFLPDRSFRGKNRILEALNLTATLKALHRGDFDVFHSTYSKPYWRKWLNGRPYVITVHDLTHEKFPDLLPSARRESAEERRSIARADAIIVPSRATRDDLISFYPEAAPKIRVIYHGFRIPDAVSDRFAGSPPYVLHVGTRAFYRDFPTAVRALAELPEYQLICAGGGPFTPDELRLFEQTGLSGRVRQFRLGESELFSAYRHAAALVFPSRAEGFGLPVIEAQSQGCVPVLADIPCFREIGGDGALYFPVGNAAACAARLRELADATRRNRLKTLAAAGLHRFNWRECARQTLELYRSLAELR